jgi:chromosome segregation ATPase
LLYVSNDASRRKLQISPIKQSMTINEGDEEKLDKVETKTITVSRSEDKEDIVNNTKRIIEEDSKGLVEKYPTLSKKFLGLDNITDETNELIDDLKNQIQILQKEVNSKDLAIKAIEIEGENKLEEFKATILSLRTELYVAQQALQQEKSIRLSLNKEINSKSDSTLATALAMAREETAAVAQEYAQACAECRALEDEVKLLKRTVEMAVKAKNEETQSAIAAATLATAASIRRAELEAETDGLLEELIETKMRCANLAEEKDNIEKKNWLLRRRLQWVTNYYLIILLLSLLLLLLLVCRIDRINGNSSKHAEINNDN